MKLISVPIFIVSLCVGILMVYITAPKQDIVFVYPTPDNISKVQYKDNSDTCYEYKQNEIECPSDTSNIENYIPQ